MYKERFCLRMYQILLLLIFNSNVYSLENLVQDECLKQLSSLDKKSRLLMIDSSTKIPNGIFSGNLWDLGNFDECYNIKSTANNETVYGKYCIGTVSNVENNPKDSKNISDTSRPKRVVRGSTLEYHGSICLPNKCTPDEILSVLNISKESFTEKYCYSRDTAPQLTTGAIITIVVLSIFLLIMAISTIFDIYLYYRKTKPPHDLIIAFSALFHGKRLFISSTNPDQLTSMNGLRAISTMWVILFHTYAIAFSAPLFNLFDVNQFMTDQWNMFFLCGTLSVDTFFTIGGAVTVYVFLKSSDKRIKFNVFSYYLHRYLRLTPALGICILVYANLLRYLGDGPVWGEIEDELSEDCLNGWWGSLFYIANFTHTTCVPQSWYLSIDMQLFLLSPLILLPLRKSEKYGVILLSILCILGVIIPFAIGYVYELNASFAVDKNTYMIYYYKQIHTRFGPYVIGMLLGYMLNKLKKGAWKVSLKPIYVYGLWLISLAGLMACLYGPFNVLQKYERLSHAFILAFQRPIWSLSLCIIIYLCVGDYGGPINSFLSLPIFQVLTKLSYSMYLVHYAVISVQYYRMRTPLFFSNFDLMFIFWGNFMLTLVLSVVLYMAFESPILVLEKYIFGRGKVVKKSRQTLP